MKKGNGFLAILLSLCILVLSVPLAAAEDGGSRYPYVFVHGMMGWGSYDGTNETYPYWNDGHGGDILDAFRAEGVECYAASVGKINSVWDRACELYAQLTGTTVDYGAAHSAKYGHARYGRSYADDPLMTTFGKMDEDGNRIKINLFGHSLGGPTVRMFAWLMAEGAAEEVEASPDDVSPLFTGGKADWIHSVTTWSAPHNGTPVSNVLYDNLGVGYMLGFAANLIGRGSSITQYDWQLEQFGLTSVPSQNIKARFDPAAVVRFVRSDDNCGYDLSIRGAAALNEKIDTADGIYYFSFTGTKTVARKNGTYKPESGMFPMFILPSALLGTLNGKKFDGVPLDSSWRENDGLVPVISGRAPFGEKSIDYETVGDQPLETGVWYVMPLLKSFSHVDYMGMGSDRSADIFREQIALIDSLA